MGQGHILDANTVALWTFNEGLADTTGAVFTDSNGLTWAMAEGTVGICDGPIAGHYARRFSNTESVAGERTAMRTATTAGIRALLIGSWTWEAFIRFPRMNAGGTSFRVFAHGGSSSSETSANNDLIQLNFFDSAGNGGPGTGLWCQAFWETGAGVNTSLSQNSGVEIPLDAWCHVAVSKNTVTKEVKVYVDGVLSTTMGYVNEPTDGSSGAWCWGANEASVSLGGGFDGMVSYGQISSVVRDATWIGNNAARLLTHDTMITDGSTHTTWDFDNAPAALDVSGNGHHLLRAGAGSAASAPGGLIDDGGRGRYVDAAHLFTWYSPTIRAALLASFTLEGWILLSEPAPANGHGLMMHGDQALETENVNFIGARILANGGFEWGSESGLGVNLILNSAAGIVVGGALHHFAIRKTFFGATFQLAFFLDGAKVYESAAGQTNPTGSTMVELSYLKLLGSHTNSTASGAIDDWRLSDIARSDAEILESYQRGGFEGAFQGGFAVGVNVIPRTQRTIARDEPTAALRRVFLTIYEDDRSTLATDAADGLAAGHLQITKNGAAFVNSLGTLTHVGDGLYYFEPPVDEVDTDGFLGLKFERTGYATTAAFAPIEHMFATGSTAPNRLRLPLTIRDADGELAAGATAAGAELQVTINGSAFDDAGGTLEPIGSGFYYYQGVPADAAEDGMIVLKYEKDGYTTSHSWFVVESAGEEEVVEAAAPTPIPVAITEVSDVDEQDHVAVALARIPQQFRGLL